MADTCMKASIAVVVVALCSSVARADEDASPPIPAAAPVAVPVPPDAKDWWERRRLARERMEAGDFAAAAEMFDALAKTAPDVVAATHARDDAALCRAWAARGLVLVPRKDLGESTVHARAANERTIDELAVLYTNAVFYGIGTGAYLAVLTEPKTSAAGILPALGLAGAAALGVYGLDYGTKLRYGVPQSMVTGMYIGLGQGIAWTVWNQSLRRRSEAWEAKTVATMIWGGATLGLIGGGLIGTFNGTTPGRASFVGSTALWTAAIAGLVTSAVAPKNDSADNTTWLAVALGLNAGTVVGALTAGRVSPTIARVRFLDLGGIGGALLAGGLYLASDSDADGVMQMAVAAGMITGLSIAWFATTHMTKDEGATSTTARWVPSFGLAPARGGAMLTLASSI